MSLRQATRSLAGVLDEIVANDTTQAHPILGQFNGVQWLRFAHLHHRHHNKIIRDILRDRSGSSEPE